MAVCSSEGLAVISRQNVDLFDAWLSAEDSAAALMMAKPDSLKEAHASNVATVRDAKHLLHASDAKEDLQSLADCSGSDTATLSAGSKSEAELSSEPIGCEKDANVAYELVGFWLSDTQLDPITRHEQRCCAHLGEERYSLSFGYG